MKKKNTDVARINPIRTCVFKIGLSPGIIFFSLIIASCTTPVPEPRYIPESKKEFEPPRANESRQLLPDGWDDITSTSKRPQIKLWIINKDYSATMVLKELQADPNTQNLLLKEEMNFIATISLHAKIPENDPHLHVTRVPASIDRKRNFSSYAYSDRGLLRRVVIFRKENTIMELELMQERSSVDFEALTSDLISIAAAIFDR